MKSFSEWIAEGSGRRDAKWLLLGKGPTFAKRSAYDLSAYNLMTLNHAIREQPARVAHVIDINVLEHCAEAFRTAERVVLPWFPHFENKPGDQDLSQLVTAHPVLRELHGQGKLLWYNLSSAPRAEPGSPVVPVSYFSVEAALGLLATAGVKTVRSLGIDGGKTYSAEFGDLSGTTLLSNGRSSFDRQFEAIAKIILRTGVDFAPLDIESPIRVFVATEDAQMLPTRVLEYSIRKHTPMTVEFVPMHESGIEIPSPKDPANRPRTPFSFQRLLIPQLAGHRGRAIYLDSDMQVFRDLRELWTWPMNGAPLLCAGEPSETGRKPQFSVMLLDCAALDWRIEQVVAQLDAGALTYQSLMYEMKIAPGFQADIDSRWNSLERYEAGETALLHYTDMDTQPWVYDRHPYGHVWFADLFEALDGGYIHIGLVKEHVARGFIRPSALFQIENKIVDPILLPKAGRMLDANFIAPYRSIHQHSGRPWTRFSAYAKALARHHYQRSPLFRLQRKLRHRFVDMKLIK